MLEVFRTRPVLKEKVWGGRKLAKVFSKELPDPRGRYGESWEVADLPEGQCLVDGGPMDGAPLGELVDLFGTDLVGSAAPGGRFPLLVKILDANDDLSVQVHPGPEHVVGKPWVHAKDECWLVLDAEPGASIIHGFRAQTPSEIFRAAVAEGAALELLQRVEVSADDVYRIAPGTIHAIGAGVALLEIQQPSDTTYRVYDYGRPGLDGKPRQLHVEDALEVLTLAPSFPDRRGDLTSKVPGVTVLANVDAYRIERFRPRGSHSWHVSAHTAQVVHVLRGSCCIEEVQLGPSQTMIIPACAERVWLTEAEDCDLVVAGLGGGPLVHL